MTTPALPRPAATVIICRPSADGFEVLLVKRSGKSGFMAGAHVFPGGRVDDADRSAADPLGFRGAAVRETLEEAGLALQGDALVEFAWWITPEAEPKRYDTRFFLAEVPAGAEARVDDHETVSFLWLDPRQVGDAYARGDVVLSPPTLAVLEDLAGFASAGAAAASVQRPLRAVCPRIVTTEGALVLALPGDPLHDEPLAVFKNRTRIVVDESGRFSSRQASATRRP